MTKWLQVACLVPLSLKHLINTPLIGVVFLLCHNHFAAPRDLADFTLQPFREIGLYYNSRALNSCSFRPDCHKMSKIY